MKDVIQGVGEEGCVSLVSPSGINFMSLPAQAAIFVAVFVGLYIGTDAFNGLLEMCNQFALFQSWKKTWPLLGVIYAAAGVSHFTLQQEFENIYPHKQAWGLWYLPGTPEFHVIWTGIAEIAGGVGLSLGAVTSAFGVDLPALTAGGLASDAALGLFILTIAVTPANIYMLTHGARLPMNGPEVPIVGHVTRLLLQVILLGLLLQMAQPSLSALMA